MKKQKNILQELVTSLNYIFVNIYFIIIYTLLINTRLIIANTFTSYIVYFTLVLFLIIGIIKYIKFIKIKDKPNEVSEYYLSFFKKEYLKTNKHYITYLLSLIVLIILLKLPNSYGSFYLWIFLIILVVTLFIRNITLKLNFKKINIITNNTKEVEPTKKQRIIICLKYLIIYILIS